MDKLEINNFKSNYILVLPSWYPSKLDEFNGDFNERLVHAVSSNCNQIVVYVSTKRDSMLTENEKSINRNIITYKTYFKNSRYDLINLIRMIKLYLVVFKQVFKEYGLPKLVHNYVFFPSGIISIYLKYRYNFKTVLTEHSSIFNYTNNPQNIYSHSAYKRIIYSLILKNFDSIIAVSSSLGASVSKWKKKSAKSFILPNVVDVNFFNKRKDRLSSIDTFTFVHVSDIGAHKNVKSILEVFNKILGDGVVAKLILVGKERETIKAIINENHLLKQSVTYLGEVSYTEVAENMKKSNAFILFSKYENMPCVILEALCCGLPVISSNVGGIATVIKKENGILVEWGNKKELKGAMCYLINNYNEYDSNKISSEATDLYNYNIIGKKTFEIYKETLK